MTKRDRTLAEELAAENDLLRRRFIHHTRLTKPLTLAEAMELCRRVEGETEPKR